MKNIMIPTDFSENAWNALRYGLELFQKTTATFHLIHIDRVVSYAGGETTIFAPPEVVEETIIRKSNEQLQELLKRIERLPLNTKHTFKTKSAYAFFVDSIQKEIAEKSIDLIIMGTKGASGLKEVTIGSNTGDVMTKIKCPLLAVPENTALNRPSEIAFPTDYLTGYESGVLDDLVFMAKMSDAKLRIVHVSKKSIELNKTQSQNQNFLSDYLRDIDHSFHLVTGNKLETAIQGFVVNRDINMIVMAAKNLNFLQRILFRPTVEKISYHTHVPFLVLHE